MSIWWKKENDIMAGYVFLLNSVTWNSFMDGEAKLNHEYHRKRYAG